jgi:Flp pilus assembly pilin Flp
MKHFMRRFVRDKRAITPVLSSLLLTVIAVAGMSIATSATYVITTNLRETMSERVAAEDVWFNPATHTIDVYLRNVGKVNIHVQSVYVNHTSRPFNTPFNLELNEDGWLTISYTWSSGNLYYIDIVTNRGTHIASYNRAL